MKTLLIQLLAVLVALATQASDAQAKAPAETSQTRPASSVPSSYGLRPRYAMRPNYYWNRGATAAESYARGLAAMTYARGQYNRLTAEARAIHAQAQSYEIENRQQAAATYFAMRQANREAQLLIG